VLCFCLVSVRQFSPFTDSIVSIISCRTLLADNVNLLSRPFLADNGGLFIARFFYTPLIVASRQEASPKPELREFCLLIHAVPFHIFSPPSFPNFARAFLFFANFTTKLCGCTHMHPQLHAFSRIFSLHCSARPCRRLQTCLFQKFSARREVGSLRSIFMSHLYHCFSRFSFLINFLSHPHRQYLCCRLV